MSHFSDIGFCNFDNDNFLDKIKELVHKFKNIVLDFTKYGNGYLVLFLPNRLDIYLGVINNQIRVDSLSFHHNTESYMFLSDFEVINKEDGLYRINYDDFAMNVVVPCSYYKLDHDENKKYMCQVALYAESIDVFDSEESFHQTKFGLTMNHESLFPIGMFDEEQNSTVLLTGIIQNIEYMINPFEMGKYLKVTVKCMEHTYECFLDFEEGQKIKGGQIISGYFYVTGKIMERYNGSEFGDIKRKCAPEAKIQTIDDLFNVLWHSWDKMTAHPNVRNDWMEYDRCCGQCAITAALVCDMFGGEIHKIKLPNEDTHYYNVIDGNVVDLTSYEGDLYSDPYQLEIDPIRVDRDYLNQNKNTVRRYNRLANNVFSYLKTNKMLKEYDKEINKLLFDIDILSELMDSCEKEKAIDNSSKIAKELIHNLGCQIVFDEWEDYLKYNIHTSIEAWNFMILFSDYDGHKLMVENPYPFLGMLYKKLGLSLDRDPKDENENQMNDTFDSIYIELLINCGIIDRNDYFNINPYNDEKLIEAYKNAK